MKRSNGGLAPVSAKIGQIICWKFASLLLVGIVPAGVQIPIRILQICGCLESSTIFVVSAESDPGLIDRNRWRAVGGGVTRGTTSRRYRGCCQNDVSHAHYRVNTFIAGAAERSRSGGFL